MKNRQTDGMDWECVARCSYVHNLKLGTKEDFEKSEYRKQFLSEMEKRATD